MRKAELVIIGGGPAGMAAAVSAYDAGCRDILLIDREEAPGGILKQCIHSGFGLQLFHEEMTGPEYADRYIRLLAERGIECLCDTMVLDLTEDRIVTAVSRTGGLMQIEAGAVILAMGCRERPRGALGIPGWRPSGIYTAGTAQKLVNRRGLLPGRRVVILGSGDIGLIMARRMTLQGARVLACVELMPYSSGLRRNIVQCLDDFGIPLILRHTVVDIHGQERLEGVTIAEVDEQNRPIGGTEQRLDCDTLLLSVGLIPENELSERAAVELCPATNGAVVDERLQTSVPGIFSCGNVLHVHDLVDDVSREAERAGQNAAAYLRGELPFAGGWRAVEAGKGVSGLVPQKISAEPDKPVTLMFRPRGVYRDAAIVVESEGAELSRRRCRILTPGEMAKVILPPEKLGEGRGSILVRIEVAP